MKAFRLESFGLDGLALQDVATPTPGSSQVLVQLKASSLNFRDLLMAKGLYDPKLPLPATLGSDGAGIVVAVGSEVTGVKVGDRVVAAFMQGWTEGPYTMEKSRSALGGRRDGTFATHVLLEGSGVVPIPSHLNYEEAATFPCAGLTAWNALFGDQVLRPGETVLVQGTGGVSIFALQFAKMAGARVIATSSSDEKLERARTLGAWETINYKSMPDWGVQARKLSNGGVDVVVEVGGSGTLKQSLDAVRYGGRIELIGVLGGAGGDVPATLILHKGVQIRGIHVGSVEMYKAMNAAVTSHKMIPVIGETFAFEDTVAALKTMESASHFGKIAIQI